MRLQRCTVAASVEATSKLSGSNQDFPCHGMRYQTSSTTLSSSKLVCELVFACFGRVGHSNPYFESSKSLAKARESFNVGLAGFKERDLAETRFQHLSDRCDFLPWNRVHVSSCSCKPVDVHCFHSSVFVCICSVQLKRSNAPDMKVEQGYSAIKRCPNDPHTTCLATNSSRSTAKEHQDASRTELLHILDRARLATPAEALQSFVLGR